MTVGEPRLAAGLEVSALLARASRLGGFGTVLHKGDAERGSLLLVILERGRHVTILERMLVRDGSYAWQQGGGAATDSNAAPQYLARRQTADPDCWVLELDIPSSERFIAEMTGSA